MLCVAFLTLTRLPIKAKTFQQKLPQICRTGDILFVLNTYLRRKYLIIKSKIINFVRLADCGSEYNLAS
jgi:hypothetical protein